MKELNSYMGIWLSMRSSKDIAQDEAHKRHLEGYCAGAPECWDCAMDKQEEEDRARSSPEHIAANHRGDDPDTIGQTPCKCAADLDDAKVQACADAFKPLARL